MGGVQHTAACPAAFGTARCRSRPFGGRSIRCDGRSRRRQHALLPVWTPDSALAYGAMPEPTFAVSRLRNEPPLVVPSAVQRNQFSSTDLLLCTACSESYRCLARYETPSEYEVGELLFGLPIQIVQPMLAIWIILSVSGWIGRLARLAVGVLVTAACTLLVVLASSPGHHPHPVDLARSYYRYYWATTYALRDAVDFLVGTGTMLAPLAIALIVALLAGYRFVWSARAANGTAAVLPKSRRRIRYDGCITDKTTWQCPRLRPRTRHGLLAFESIAPTACQRIKD